MLYDYLYDWQKPIIDQFKDRNTFGLYLDMGLGKTLLSLAFAEQQKSEKILIITIETKACETEDQDGSFLYWAKKMEIPYSFYNKKWSFRDEGVKKRRVKISSETKDLLILNYEATYESGHTEIINGKKHKNCVLTHIVEDFIKSCKNQNVTMIVDECHNIKELSSLKTKALFKIKRDLQLNGNKVYTYLLSGTPFTQGYIDLYSQLKILGWEGNKTLFEEAFCLKGNIGGLYPWQQPIIGYQNIDKLYELIHKFAITIKSEKVIKLPEKVIVEHKLPNNEDMILFTCEKLKKSRIEEYVKNKNINLPYKLEESPRGGQINNPFYRNIAFPELKWEAETVGTFWMRSRQLSIGFQGNSEEDRWFDKSRLQELEKLLSEHPDNYVLFYNYVPEFLEIFDICEKLGYNVDVCNGDLKSSYFYEKYRNQSEGERLVNNKNIILANFASGSAGSNWQLYNKCILFSIPVFKDWEQSLKRVHRIGQKETVIYHIFYANNWLDLSMMKTLKESKEYDNNLFESDLKRIQTLLSQDERFNI